MYWLLRSTWLRRQQTARWPGQHSQRACGPHQTRDRASWTSNHHDSTNMNPSSEREMLGSAGISGRNGVPPKPAQRPREERGGATPHLKLCPALLQTGKCRRSLIRCLMRVICKRFHVVYYYAKPENPVICLTWDRIKIQNSMGSLSASLSLPVTPGTEGCNTQR